MMEFEYKVKVEALEIQIKELTTNNEISSKFCAEYHERNLALVDLCSAQKDTISALKDHLDVTRDINDLKEKDVMSLRQEVLSYQQEVKDFLEENQQ